MTAAEAYRLVQTPDMTEIYHMIRQRAMDGFDCLYLTQLSEPAKRDLEEKGYKVRWTIGGTNTQHSQVVISWNPKEI